MNHPEATDANKPTECHRCGRPIESEKVVFPGHTIWKQFCRVCEARNIHDGLGLPTPPALLDPFSKRPTLSEREFREELHKDRPDDWEE